MKPNSASTDPAPAPRSRVGGSLRALALGLAIVLASDSARAAQVPAGGGQRGAGSGSQEPTPGEKGAAPAKPAPDAAAIAAAKAAEAARLKAEFDRIASDLRTAVAGFQAEISGLQQKGVPREQWPPHPNIPYYSRFEELAFQDQPDALRWCLAALGQIGIGASEVAERKAEIYARLVVIHPDLTWMSDVARWIQSDGSPGGIGFERADDLLRALADGTTVQATRASALAARSALLSVRTDPASRTEYERIVRELAEKHADTPAGANAKGRLFQAQYLVPGKAPPDVEAVDTDGKPLRLADYRGKVLVLEFWGFW